MNKLILPGLIDPHVHLRDPKQTQKEDFYTGTTAALAGGYTTVIDMPNNKIPITSLKRLEEKISIAKKKIVCDVGFYFGSLGDNLEEFPKVINKVLGLKLFLNQTTGNFLIDKNNLQKIFLAWESRSPILVHAEDKMIAIVLEVVKKTGRHTHFCHVSTKADLALVLRAKKANLPITCGVTPHHLFLTEHDEKILGPFGKMKPPLAKRKDVDFLWKNLNLIDIIECDHAPHTIDEKTEKFQISNFKFQIPYGVPGLETTLPLLLTAVSENRLTVDDVTRLCFANPARIFNINTNPDTKVKIDLHKSYIIDNKSLHTKCGWSPFNGWKVRGEIRQVKIRGIKVYENGKVLVKPGDGKVIS